MKESLAYYRELSRKGVEVWLPVVGFERTYQVSNLGRVRSIDRTYDRNRRLKGKMLAANGKPYLSVVFYKDGETASYRIHRLVLSAFDPITENLWVNHIDECKTNNCLYNLEWVTPSQNANHGTRNVKCGAVKKKEIAMLDMEGRQIKVFSSIQDAAIELGLSYHMARNYAKGAVKHNKIGVQLKYLKTSNVCQVPLTS